MSPLARLDPGDPMIRTALGALLQASAVILVAAVVAGTALRRHAAARHNVWLGALVWVLLSPAVAALAGRAGPTLRVVTLPLPSPGTIGELDQDPDGAAALGDPKPGRSVPPAEPGRSSSGVSAGRGPDEPGRPAGARVARPLGAGVAGPPRALRKVGARRGAALVGGVVVLWAAGLLIGLGRIAAGGRRVAALTRSARPLDHVRYRAMLTSVCDVLGVEALPPVMTSARAAGPVTLGLLWPRVVLPDGLAEAVTSGELRDVLVHECAHAIRRDPWVGLLQLLAGALFWPHPLVHYLNGQLTRAREEVCDNHVLECDDACGYARTLLTLTERYRPFRMPRAGLGLLGARWTLADRVAGLLDPGRIPVTRTPVAARVAAAAALAATGLTAASVRLAPPARADGPEGPSAGQAAPAPETPRAGVWRIEGVVVDEQGRPVAGAMVRPPASADQLGVGGGTTAADGRFTLTLGGRHRSLHGLVAEADGGARVGLTRNGAPLTYLTRDPVRIVLKPTRPLTVRVRDSTGAPIAGAAVEAVDYGYQTQGSTGPGGTATLRVAADARIRWVIGQKAGAGLDYFENYQPARPAEYPPLPPELSLTLDGALPLRIKAVDSKGRPVPGVRMSPWLIQRPAKVDLVSAAFATTSWVTTDGSGLAVFDRFHKEVGGCGFAVRSDMYICAQEPVSERDGPTELTALLLRPTRLSGTVRLPDGRPARNILVRVEGCLPYGLGTEWLARTREDGAYSLEVRPESVYVVAVEDETWAAPSRTGVVVREHQPQGGLDFTLARGTLLHGQLTEGADLQPAGGSGVSLVEEGPLLPKEFRRAVRNGRLTRGASADARGRYRFRVGPGRYTLRAGSAAPLEVEVKDEPEVVRDLTMKTSARERYFTVVVVEKRPAGDRPVSRASVSLLFAGGGRTGPNPSDDHGRVRMVRRPDTVVYARGDDGRLTGLAPVPETAETVTVVVAPAAQLTGRVVDTNGTPQARRRVLIQLTFGANFVASHRYDTATRTDEQGRFTYLGVPAGTTGEVSANHEKDGRATGARTVVPFKVDEPDRVEVLDLVVPPSRPAEEAARDGEAAGRPGAVRPGS